MATPKWKTDEEEDRFQACVQPDGTDVETNLGVIPEDLSALFGSFRKRVGAAVHEVIEAPAQYHGVE